MTLTFINIKSIERVSYEWREGGRAQRGPDHIRTILQISSLFRQNTNNILKQGNKTKQHTYKESNILETQDKRGGLPNRYNSFEKNKTV